PRDHGVRAHRGRGRARRADPGAARRAGARAVAAARRRGAGAARRRRRAPPAQRTAARAVRAGRGGAARAAAPPGRRRRPARGRGAAGEPGGRVPRPDGHGAGGWRMNVSRYALSVWQRNLAMYRRTWKLNILPNFFEPLLYLVSIGVGVGAYVSEMGGTSYVAFLAPGLVAVAAMNGASFEVTYNAFVRLNFEKTY